MTSITFKPPAAAPPQVQPMPTVLDKKLRAAADKLEASFLSEMLKAAKFGEPRESFGGGAGEAQFASFLRQEVAEDMVRAGGLGLSEHIFNSLKARSNGN